MRLKVTIEYAGTRYSGWQIQKKRERSGRARTRDSRGHRCAASFEIYGSGRTDAGVHALGAGRARRHRCNGPAGDVSAARSTTRCRATSTSFASSACGTAFTRGTTRSRAATSIRSRAGARRSPSLTSGGSRTTSTCRDAADSRTLRRDARLPVVLGRRPGREVHAGAGRHIRRS